MSRSITREFPFVVRLGAYLAERFPPLRHGILVAAYYTANQFLAAALTDGDTPMRLTPRSVAGALAVLCVFLLLRVLDEHKDFEEDRRKHPERVLQRGLVTLRDLRFLGGLCTAFVLLVALRRGVPALVAMSIVLGFAALMFQEFFVRTWLRRHLLAYAASHILIAPLIAAAVYSFTTGRYPWTAPGCFWLYASVRFFLFIDWEISRKIEQNMAAGEGYAAALGRWGAPAVVLAARVVASGLVAAVAARLALAAWLYAVPAGLLAVSLAAVVAYGAGRVRWLSISAAAYILLFDVALAGALAARYGLEVDWR